MMKLVSAALFCFLIHKAGAQSCGFTLNKWLPPSDAVRLFSPIKHRLLEASPRMPQDYLLPVNRMEKPRSGVFLPRWSADQLPFFCKIEHDWAKGTRIPLKFRLGSVEYVDALEGH